MADQKEKKSRTIADMLNDLHSGKSWMQPVHVDGSEDWFIPKDERPIGGSDIKSQTNLGGWGT